MSACAVVRACGPALGAPMRPLTTRGLGPADNVPIRTAGTGSRQLTAARCSGRDREPVSPSAGADTWVFAAPAHARKANEPPSLLDVRDALEACQHVASDDERAQCYLNFGLDSDRVEQYYEPVMRMERAFEANQPEDDELAQRMVRGAGVFLFLLMGVKAL
uniref:Uncharacterized protein n=1 Tax=Chlamydomonas euryale TaxID=1486919 RepID=A0A7R9VWH7_9CHLO|mmetsp:Transcript_559/g.1501  ORF Transcript_559/g.1501 Transcript_559/m.1501 type:complete len:162 (+) Transcript_559:244-729(+)